MNDKTDTKQSYRFKLGPVVTDLIATLPEQSPAALDAKVSHLLETNTEQKRQLEQNHELMMSLSQSNQTLSHAVERVSTGVSSLHVYCESRFTDLCHLVMHLAENLGSHFAQDKGERELRAKRMRAIEEKAQARLETLGMHLEAEHKGRDKMIAQLAGRVEEERLSLIASRQRESRVLDQGQER